MKFLMIIFILMASGSDVVAEKVSLGCRDVNTHFEYYIPKESAYDWEYRDRVKNISPYAKVLCGKIKVNSSGYIEDNGGRWTIDIFEAMKRLKMKPGELKELKSKHAQELFELFGAIIYRENSHLKGTLLRDPELTNVLDEMNLSWQS